MNMRKAFLFVLIGALMLPCPAWAKAGKLKACLTADGAIVYTRTPATVKARPRPSPKPAKITPGPVYKDGRLVGMNYK